MTACNDAGGSGDVMVAVTVEGSPNGVGYAIFPRDSYVRAVTVLAGAIGFPADRLFSGEPPSAADLAATPLAPLLLAPVDHRRAPATIPAEATARLTPELRRVVGRVMRSPADAWRIDPLCDVVKAAKIAVRMGRGLEVHS